jgi:hypothetical protein
VCGGVIFEDVVLRDWCCTVLAAAMERERLDRRGARVKVRKKRGENRLAVVEMRGRDR